MFKAFGTVIILYALSQFFQNSMLALDTAVTATFETIATAAHVAETTLVQTQP